MPSPKPPAKRSPWLTRRRLGQRLRRPLTEPMNGPLSIPPSRRPLLPAIFVRLLGPYRITVDGTEITKGLRTAAKELLAWYLLRPEGASAAAAVDALWPDTPPELVAKRFWRALGNLRTALCAPGSSDRPEVLMRSGDNYRPRADELDCDVWRFQSHLRRSRRFGWGRAQ